MRVLQAKVFVLSALFFLSLTANAVPVDSNKHAKSANDTTVKHVVTRIYTQAMLEPSNIWKTGVWAPDTELHRLENYVSHYSLGNPGLPLTPVIFNGNSNPLGFYYGKDYLTDYFYSDSSLRYYDTRAPYLNFFYVTDPQIHQYLDLVLTQNVMKNLNVAITFKRIRSEGIYLNQGSNTNQLTGDLNYHNKRYMVLTNGIYDIFKVNQNGGLHADSDFTNAGYISQRQAVPVYLATARTTQRETSFHLKQFYFFGYKSGDSAKENPLFYISHTMRAAGHSNIYRDATLGNDSAGFYPAFYHDSSYIYDSLRYTELTNDISIGSGKGQNKVMRWELGAKYQWVHYRNFSAWGNTQDTSTFISTDTIIANLIVHGHLYNTWAKDKILFDASGQEIISGTQQGDMNAGATLGYKLDSLRLVTLYGSYAYQTPALIYDIYYGNNLGWHNQFNKVTTTIGEFKYADAKWHIQLDASITQIMNDTYFGADANPYQYGDVIDILKASLEKDFTHDVQLPHA